ncbi:deacetylase SIR2 [Mesomycoplasma conjunctivae]|uniref:deacetylase SIR2 n=1 Tax=Mesomycoplasma conjunctivae TaxID=45361 RepID=UPI003DA4D873
MNSKNLKITNLDQDSQEILALINQAEAIVVGIGSGLTAADGIGYAGFRFEEHFGDFIEKYRFLDMLQASLFDFPNWQTYWAFHSRFIKLNYFDLPKSASFLKLKEILANKNYFIITTNSDSSLEVNDFDQSKIFYIQGKYNLLQCSKMCQNILYKNDKLINQMVKTQQNMQIDATLLPKCPNCDAFLEVNKRIAYKGMVEDATFLAQQKAYDDFLKENQDKKVLFWEIGVGYTTPQLIKWAFWKMCLANRKSTYLVFNAKNYHISSELKKQTKIYHYDIAKLIDKVWQQGAKNDFNRTN